MDVQRLAFEFGAKIASDEQDHFASPNTSAAFGGLVPGAVGAGLGGLTALIGALSSQHSPGRVRREFMRDAAVMPLIGGTAGFGLGAMGGLGGRATYEALGGHKDPNTGRMLRNGGIGAAVGGLGGGLLGRKHQVPGLGAALGTGIGAASGISLGNLLHGSNDEEPSGERQDYRAGIDEQQMQELMAHLQRHSQGG